MGAIFGGGPKITPPPPPPPPPNPPSPANTAQAVAGQQQVLAAQAGAGYGGTLLTGGQGAPSGETTKQLTGT